jgi:ankyrin repeat protein
MDQGTIFNVSNKAEYQAPTKESTQLFNAALAGSETGVLNAIKAGGKVNYFHQPENKQTALHIAAENGTEGVVRVLIENDALIDAIAVTNKDTPLVLAAGAGHDTIVAMLLAKGANANHQNAYGSSPLHQAAKNHHTGCVKSLLAAGADVHLKNNKGSSPLLLACYQEDKKGALAVFTPLLEAGASVDDTDNNKSTALHIAASVGNDELLDLLLQRGADPKLKDSGGFTPLKMAEFHNNKLGSGVVAKLS